MEGITFGAVTRGDGRVFVQLVPPTGASGTWIARAYTRDGREAPAKIVLTASGEAVLAVPAFTVDLVARVQLAGEDGVVEATGEFLVRQRACKLRSQMNTLLKNADAQRIRNCDRTWRAYEARITDVRIIPANDEKDILRFYVTQRIHDGKTPSYEVAAIDSAGNDVSLGFRGLIGETVYDSPDYPGVTHHRAAFSVGIPAGLVDFCIWVKDADRPQLDTFDCLWPERANALRDDWRRLSRPAEFDPAYHDWFEKHKATPSDLRMQRRAQGNFEMRPKFSLVVPLFNTPVEFFRDMAGSVLSQTYDNWELVLVNASPEDSELAGAVSALASRDERVHVVKLERNLGISEGTNAGVAVATGDFVAFLDHDDLIEPDLLYWYVEGLSHYPETDLFYCDEDKLEDGCHTFPFFKPDWDPIFLETNNYVCHLLCVRRSLLAELPLPTGELEGAQDYHIALAVGERARNVYHARRVLYHQRIHDISAAFRVDAKAASVDVGKIALERHFERIGLEAVVKPAGRIQHCYRLSTSSHDVAALATVVATGREANAIAVDAASAATDYLAFIDPAVSVGKDQLARILFWASRPGVGAVAPKVVLPDGSVKGMGVISSEFSVACPILRDFPEGHAGLRGYGILAHQVSAVRGDCLVVPRALYERVGGILEDCGGVFWPIALCLALREAGFMVVVDPSVEVVAPMDADDLSENDWETGRAWRDGECELMACFSSNYVAPDHHYSPNLEQEGRYGLFW